MSCVLEALKDAALRTHQKLFVLWPFGLVLCKAKESTKIIRRMWENVTDIKYKLLQDMVLSQWDSPPLVFTKTHPCTVSDHRSNFPPSLAAIPADTNFLPWKLPSLLCLLSLAQPLRGFLLIPFLKSSFQGLPFSPNPHKSPITSKPLKCERSSPFCWCRNVKRSQEVLDKRPLPNTSQPQVLSAAHTHHKLTKLMKLGENSLSSELLSCGGSPFTTCVNWSNTLFHLG